MIDEIYSHDISVEDPSPEAGECFSVICPHCGGKVTIAKHGWWEPKCCCGYTWEIVIRAIGTKEV